MRLVLFDVDGTLVDRQNIICAALSEMLTGLGRPVPERSFMLGGVGLSLVPTMRRLLGESALEAEIEAATEGYRHAFQRLRADPVNVEPLFPGAVEVVEALRARSDIVLGIATGKSRRGVSHIIERLGWHSHFATVQTADDAPSKPDPTMVLQAARAVGLDPASAIMIGDTTFDMAMACSAGCSAVGVSWGNHPVEALRVAGAHHVIDHFDELVPLISKDNWDRAA